MAVNKQLLDYQNEFGDLDYRQGVEARSVYSPAAYLADLLQLLEDHVKGDELGTRRPDLKKIILNGDHTFSLIPYLDIVNELLESRVENLEPGVAAYATLKFAKHPLSLPFDRASEESHHYLDTFEVPAEKVYQQFSIRQDSERVAQLSLKLDDETVALLLRDTASLSVVKQEYGLIEADTLDDLTDISRFLDATGLTRTQLHELVYQTLSDEEKDLATRFFTNHDLDGYVVLNDDDERLVWHSASAEPAESIKPEWFERANRLIRLARHTGMSLLDLDLILRSCNGNQLNASALQSIALIGNLSSTHDLPIDVVCSLFSNMNPVGFGTDPGAQPVDLFNRVFNAQHALLEGTYLQTSAVVPEQYKDLEQLTFSGDLFTTRNARVLKRVGRVLRLSDTDLALIDNALLNSSSEHTDVDDDSSNNNALLNRLSVYHRISVLVITLDWSVEDLLLVLNVLQNDPWIRRYSNYPVLIASTTNEFDGLRILSTGSTQQRLWLVQMLFALARWMQSNQLSAAELSEILTGQQRNELNAISHKQLTLDALDTLTTALAPAFPELARWMRSNQFTADKLSEILTGQQRNELGAIVRQQRTIAELDTLVQGMLPTFPQSDAFITSAINNRQSRVLYETLLASAGSIVSAHDHRLYLQLSDDNLASMAHQVLTSLRQIREADFLELGVHGRVRDKLFDNLVWHGYLDTAGSIVERTPAESVSGVGVSRSYDSARVFDIILELQRSLASESEFVSDDLEGVTVLLSDFDALELDVAAQQELFDNLTFNRYIDDQGNVRDVDFFLDETNRYVLNVESDLSIVEEDVQEMLAQKRLAFEEATCRIDISLFADLGLTPVELADLLENLRFNHYIDDTHRVIDKMKLLELDVKDFTLVLQFYPLRRRILDELQQHIRSIKQTMCVVNREDLDSIAQQMIARSVMSGLDGHSLKNGVFFVLDHDSVLTDDTTVSLPRFLDEHAKRQIQIFVQQLRQESQHYLLSGDSFSAVEFAEIEVDGILDRLIQASSIEPDGTLNARQFAYFQNINNALTFQVDDLADHAKDIFFVVHALATRMSQFSDGLIDVVKRAADVQERTLLAALEEFLEIDVELARVVCGHILGTSTNLVEAYLVPLLRAVDTEKRLKVLPTSPAFGKTLQQIRQFAQLATRLGLTPKEADIVFRDQNLVEKFAEPLALPAGIEVFDFLVVLTIDASRFQELAGDGLRSVVLLYSTKVQRYWLYDVQTHDLLADTQDLAMLTPALHQADLQAGFNDADGNAWLLSSSGHWKQPQGESEWQEMPLTLGLQSSRFDAPQSIDAALVDSDQQIYLFAGNQYLRSGNALETFDDGYPRQVEGNWAEERDISFPAGFDTGIDAAFFDTRGTLHAFQGQRYGRSDSPGVEQQIAQAWGHVRNNFLANERIDAAMALGELVYFFTGDQCLSWSSSVEDPKAVADVGSLQLISELIPGLPPQFAGSIDAIFHGSDDRIHLFKGENTLTLTTDLKIDKPGTLASENWGAVYNTLAQTGLVSAALSGLDGRAYVFSGTQYVRFSGTAPTYVDEGYPRTIEGDWGGLTEVHAAFILDGKTYLVGKSEHGEDSDGEVVYVRYSTSDYRQQDTLLPAIADEVWWMEHFNLIDSEFATPDCVFIAADGVTYLFSGNSYIAYDELHRWWTQPAQIDSKWSGLPFATVDAAFTGKDGRTWFFSGSEHACYNDPDFNRMDARYPSDTATHWGNVRNRLVDERRIDSALVINARDTDSLVDDATYLFSGDQFVRYSENPYTFVDEGYPKSIESQWHNEPCMLHHTGARFKHIDAAFSDRRHLYLFDGKQCQVVSGKLDERYSLNTGEPVSAVVKDAGVVYLHAGNQWRALQGLESLPGPRLQDVKSVPPMLKASPELIRDTLSTGFTGADGVQYLFSRVEGLCYNAALERSYPIGEEWGRIRNAIVEDQRVDAAFAGTDGRTYLFRARQYLAYADPGAGLASFSVDDSMRQVDALPGLISDDWGGLESVDVAFVRDGKTYLLEHADEHGQFRYVCYSSSDYSRPDGSPRTVDVSWWEYPSAYLDEGFNSVDSVLLDDEHVYLFNGAQFIQYNIEEDIWTYPRPVSLLWRSLPFEESLAEHGITAFTSHDSTTWFFCAERVVAYTKKNTDKPAVDAVITERWVGIRNNITHQNAIDAAVVLAGDVTYLFSDDQFVRYTGTDYRYVDDGYPRLVATELRHEPAFLNMPADTERTLATLFKEGGRLTGVLADERHRLLFTAHDCHIISEQLQGAYDIARLGALHNVLHATSRIDAAFNDAKGRNYLFSGDQYVRYTGDSFDLVDSGYPKSIQAHFAMEGSGIVFDPLLERIDAAVQLPTGELRVFVGASVYSSLSPGSITPLDNLIALARESFPGTVDAAFVAPDGRAYFFSGSRYIRYAKLGNEFVDEGFPRAIADNWGNLDPYFEESIDHAFVFAGRTYLVKDDRYVRYTDAAYQHIDGFYPQTISSRWGQWSDYLLSDLKTIVDFKSATARRSAHGDSLVSMLDDSVAYVQEPYRLLADVFGWPIDQIKWLKRYNAFLPDHGRSETSFDIEVVLAMIDIFTLAARFDVTPQVLYEGLFVEGADEGRLPDNSSAHLEQWLAQRSSEQDWVKLSTRLHNELNEKRNAVLLPFIISRDSSVANSRELFAQLLIDVEMGGDAVTSRIKEAITATQLYLHRYFTNLETLELKGSSQTPDKTQLKQWWGWLRNYRVWEANRKVFLYPENYIQPELRDTKSDTFTKLEQTLLQGDVNPERVATAFHDYMNEFARVGNLRITGANVYDDPNAPDEQILVLFGHTRTEPGQYYYRTARFTPSGRALWENWIPMEINIDSSRVFPVYAFGRVLLFWTEVEAYEEAMPVIQTRNSAQSDTNATSTVETSDSVLRHRATVKYSFYDFNKRWINPQTLTRAIKLEYRIDAMFADGRELVAFSGEYCLRSTVLDPQGTVKTIAASYPQIPGHFHKGIDAAVLFIGELYLFKGDRLVILRGSKPQDVPINSVFKSAVRRPDDTGDLLGIALSQTISGQFAHPVGFAQGVSAAFLVKSKNQLCLIDKRGLPTFFRTQVGAQHFREQIIEDVIDQINGESARPESIFIIWLRILTRNLLVMEPVDAVFEDEFGIIYVLRQGQYECYRYADEFLSRLEPLDGFPKPIKGNLSFNMDKFFDKLHVVRDVEGDREIVELTYSSPEANTALLTGQIMSDLTFHEGDLRVDFTKSQLVGDNLRLPQPTLLLNQDYRREKLEFKPSEAAGVFKNVLDLLGKLADREQQVDKLQVFLDLIDTYIESQGDLTQGRQAPSAEMSEQIELASSQDPVFGLEQAMLAQGVASIIESFNTFARGRSESLHERRLEKLVEVNAELSAMLIEEIQQLETQRESTLAEVQPLMNDIGERMEKFHTFIDWHTNYQFQLDGWHDTMIVQPFVQQHERTLIDHVDGLLPAYSSARVTAEALSPTATSPVVSSLSNVTAELNKVTEAKANFLQLSNALDNLHDQVTEIATAVGAAVDAVASRADVLKERYYGKDDVFPEDFGIRTNSNFTFGQPDWHVFEAASGSFLCRPLLPAQPVHYEILRISSTTIPALSRQLFANGVDGLLSLETQKTDELPAFIRKGVRVPETLKNDDVIVYSPSIIGKSTENNDRVPGYKTLDFDSANASYYREVFFHAPFLIAQTLNRAQKFDEARGWYEYIFDPTVTTSGQHWQFLPFSEPSASGNFPSDSLNAVLNDAIDIADLGAELQVYLNDPFDPHAIAGIRQVAYKKAIVMRSIDNLLDWGDVLFGQYTVESINEARMLYVFAYELLGEKPESLGRKKMGSAQAYEQLVNPSEQSIGKGQPITDVLLGSGDITELDLVGGTIHRSVRSEYFHIPENTVFLEYWTRVEDRLFKIRNSLNIKGLRQTLPLFQPPIDPMSIVQAVAGGASLSQITSAAAVAVPHYRFGFMYYKANELAQRLNQFGNELLAAIEKGDAEQLGLMQHKQERTIISMMSRIREAQVAEAQEGFVSLESSLAMVKKNQAYNQSTVDDDLLDTEIVQLALMGTAVAGHIASTILKVLASFGSATPDSLIGPFIMGLKFGGSNLGSAFSSASEAVQTAAEGLSVGGEILGIVAQHQRLMADTQHQVESATHEIAQIQAQMRGAELQVKVAEYELEVHRKEMEHHDAISTYMTNKFSNEQLYQWLSGQLSGIYYQSYKMAHSMAKSAERAYQFERGLPQSDVDYIGSLYWNSQRKGLLAGESLGVDLGRMEQAYLSTDERRLEIIKSISLMSLDPLALLQLKALGTCEFELGEALFDYDFAGHYCRQVKTIEVVFDAPDGQTVNASLTQLNHKTVMTADVKAVKYLMDPKDLPPSSIRSDWRASQQIVLSHVDEYEKSNGMFETRLDDDRYLPFEGTGAVSKWRIDLGGKRGSIDLNELLDVTLVFKYTALQGGERFGNAVRGMLKPYDTVHLLDLNFQFHQQWLGFLESPDDSVELAITRDLLPNMAGGRITGLFTNLDTFEGADMALRLNDDEGLVLRHGAFLDTSGLSISPRGSKWTLSVLGDKSQLRNVQLVIGYKALV